MMLAEDGLLFTATATEIRGALLAIAAELRGCAAAYHLNAGDARKAFTAAVKKHGGLEDGSGFSFWFAGRGSLNFKFGATPQGYRDMRHFLAIPKELEEDAAKLETLANRVPMGDQLVSAATLSRLKLVPSA